MGKALHGLLGALGAGVCVRLTGAMFRAAKVTCSTSSSEHVSTSATECSSSNTHGPTGVSRHTPQLSSPSWGAPRCYTMRAEGTVGTVTTHDFDSKQRKKFCLVPTGSGGPSRMSN
jgi:hypothetical protein